jgi:hypothetical protein
MGWTVNPARVERLAGLARHKGIVASMAIVKK